MSDTLVHSVSLMGTVVTIQVVGHGASSRQQAERAAAIERAFEWFRVIEACCTRFDERSELRQLSRRVGEPVQVTELLFEVVNFAMALASETDGAFDPTVGREMESRGFNRNYRTGEITDAGALAGLASYRDVVVDPHDRTITLRNPLLLDLGAVAKGFAIDIAARELQPFINFAIDAGGDLYLGGKNANGEPWSVGLRHPHDAERLIDAVHVSNSAVCTSGNYEARGTGDADHIVDLRAGGRGALPPAAEPDSALASVTVIAPSAMAADGLATAAFVLGPTDGIALLERHGARGLLFTKALERFEAGA